MADDVPPPPRVIDGVTVLNRRHRVFLEAGGLCTYCAGQMVYRQRLGTSGGALDPHDVTIEHLQAKSKGGADRLENIAAACVACNNSKNDDTPAWEFREMRMRLLPEWPPCTFPPLSVRRRETGIRPITKRFQTVFDNVSNAYTGSAYWRRWFGRSETCKVALVWDRQNGTMAVKRRQLLEHLPGRARGTSEVLWRFGPLRKIKLIKGRSAAYEDHDWLFDYGWFNPWRECVDRSKVSR